MRTRKSVWLLVAAACAGAASTVGAVPEAPQLAGTYTFRRVAGLADRSGQIIDGPVATARFAAPHSITRGSDGTVYVGDSGFFITRRLKDNVVSTVSSTVRGVMAVAGDGTLYVVFDAVVYRQIPGGTLQPWAGSQEGFANGPVASARFSDLRGVAVDGAGNVYVSEGFPGFHGYCFPDQAGNMVRKITPAGEVSTLAGAPCQVGSTDGQGAAARFDTPGAMVADAAGTLFVIDTLNYTVRRIAADGTVSTLAGLAGQAGLSDGAGAAARFQNPRFPTLTSTGVYLVDGPGEAPLLRFISFSGVVSTVSTLPSISSLTMGGDGNFLVTYRSTIASMTPQGVLTTVAGFLPDPTAGPGFADGPGAVARFSDLRGAALDDRGGLYVSDASNALIRYVSAAGEVSTFAGALGQSGAMDGQGAAARFNLPGGLALGRDGNLYVADEYNALARRATPGGVVTTLPVTVNNPEDITVGPDGTVYVCDEYGPVMRLPVSGAPGIFVNSPCNKILAEPSGNVIVMVPFNTYRRFAPDGTLLGNVDIQLRAADSAGRLYGWRTSGGANFVRRIDPDGTTYDFATQIVPTPGMTSISPAALGGSREVYFHDLAVNDAGDVYLVAGYEIWVGTLTPAAAPAVSAVTTTPVWPGTPAHLSATVTGSPQPAVQWQRSDDGGATWSEVANDTVFSGARTPTLTIASATRALTAARFRLTAVNLDGTATTAAASVTLTALVARPSSMTFGAVRSALTGQWTAAPAAQQLVLEYAGTGAPTWTVTASHPWVIPSVVSGTGSRVLAVSVTDPGGSLASATLTVTALRNGLTDVFTIPVAVTVVTDGFPTAAPFGVIDTPAPNVTGLSGSLAVTGWALDDVGVRHVRVWRNCVEAIDRSRGACVTPHAGQPDAVYVGEAALIAGARPDVEAAFPSYPNAQRAGWGLLVLTNLLPDLTRSTPQGGQGSFELRVYATDVEGRVTALGARTITLDNAAAVTPFGAVDTPAQGGTVSGQVPSFGWVLTPDNGTSVQMPLDGSTITVFIDGAAVGTVLYNQCRGGVGTPPPPGVLCDDDVAGAFRGDGTRYRNLDAGRGAIGVRTIDTTTLANGQHTIVWSVTDSLGRAEAIGSRYFFVQNTGADGGHGALADQGALRWHGALGDQGALRDVARPGVEGRDSTTRVRTGFDLDAPFVPLEIDQDGVANIAIPVMGRVELHLPGVVSGAMMVAGHARDLPVGLGIDVERGRVTWVPGPGHSGTYRLVFDAGDRTVTVDVTVSRQ